MLLEAEGYRSAIRLKANAVLERYIALETTESHLSDLSETVPRREKPDLDLPAATRTAEVMTRPGLPGGRWSGIGTPLCGQRIRLRLPPPERRSAARLRASVGLTEAGSAQALLPPRLDVIEHEPSIRTPVHRGQKGPFFDLERHITISSPPRSAWAWPGHVSPATRPRLGQGSRIPGREEVLERRGRNRSRHAERTGYLG